MHDIHSDYEILENLEVYTYLALKRLMRNDNVAANHRLMLCLFELNYKHLMNKQLNK